MKNLVLIIISTTLFLTSCVKKKTTTNENILGKEYFPIQSGKFIIYQVDSTIYKDLPKDTIEYKYLIKEKIADAFIDNTGKNAFRIERFIKKFDPKKSYDSMPWVIKEVFLLNASDASIQILESNQLFTKLIFPVQAKASWNGNAFNSLGEQTYIYNYIDNAETINNHNFSNVLLVIQKEFRPLVLDQYYIEKYAKGYGLIYKEIIDVVSNKNVTTKPVLDRIESGLIYKQKFLSIGYE